MKTKEEKLWRKVLNDMNKVQKHRFSKMKNGFYFKEFNLF